MSLFTTKSEAEKEQERVAKEVRKRQEADERLAARRTAAREAYMSGWGGYARKAFQRGDHLLQCMADLSNQAAYTVAMATAGSNESRANPIETLNDICREGWELINASVVFIEQGQVSRDKFMSSGQQVGVSGVVRGYYLFKRCEANKAQPDNAPWESIQ